MTNVFLHAPQDFHNVCLLARTLEVFGQRECYVFDPHALIRERYGKMRSRELRAVSAGAFEKIRWLPVDEPEQFLAEYPGRSVATVIDPAAQSLVEYQFSSADLLLFGAESTGLPASIVAACSLAITIPMSGQTQSLNLAVTLGIVLFERQRQRATAPSTHNPVPKTSNS